MSFLKQLMNEPQALRYEPRKWPRNKGEMLFLGTMVLGTVKLLFGEKNANDIYFAVDGYDADGFNLVVHLRSDVEEGIAGAIRDGALKCFLRPKAGGAFRPCPRSIWNTEQLRERFEEFDLDPNKPFQLGRPANRKEWIWIEQESAQRFSAVLQAKKNSGNYNNSVVRLFSDTTKELSGKVERRAPKAAAVRQAILEICPYGIPETNQEKVIVEDIRAKASEIFGGSIDPKTVRREIKKVFG
ncbi:hypothetical protein [Rhizobium rhizogenes]|uniref:hypothetical protein n=1 Tax=Rhizobium rhizogenes TaxID=359 RepID=UPI0022C5B519|nr:hypothetical protein [Rhizobium rhizogenes]MCZ7463556.1 hypothetical protein [Rhizobium rhizogenes]